MQNSARECMKRHAEEIAACLNDARDLADFDAAT